jgi:hypothetical protein
MVRTYWFFPVFHEASGNLGLQPFARIDHVESKSRPCYVRPHSTRPRSVAKSGVSPGTALISVTKGRLWSNVLPTIRSVTALVRR